MNPKKIADAFARWIAEESALDEARIFSAFSPREIPADAALVVSSSVDSPHERNTFGGWRALVVFRLHVAVSAENAEIIVRDFYDFFEDVLRFTAPRRREMNELFADAERVRVESFALNEMPEPALEELGTTYEVSISVVGEIDEISADR